MHHLGRSADQNGAKDIHQKPFTTLPGTADLSPASLTASVKAPNGQGGINIQFCQPCPGLDPPIYTKSQPHQLHRLAIPRSGLGAESDTLQTKVQAKVYRPVSTGSESLPHGGDQPSPSPLVHRGRHSLVRRSSGSILSAVAKTVAAVSTNSALRASKRWSRSGKDSKFSSALNRDAVSKAGAPSRQPTLTRPRMSAKVAGRKEAFQWQRGQTAPSSVNKSSVHSRRLASIRKATLSKRPYKQLQGTKASKGGPAKLVRVGGVLYRVSGIGRGQSLKRQVTPKSLPRPSLLSQVKVFARSTSYMKEA